MFSNKTLAIIKPDVSPQQADEIMQLIELKGFTIITKSYRQVGTAPFSRLKFPTPLPNTAAPRAADNGLSRAALCGSAQQGELWGPHPVHDQRACVAAGVVQG
jgi:hypothetical protein